MMKNTRPGYLESRLGVFTSGKNICLAFSLRKEP